MKHYAFRFAKFTPTGVTVATAFASADDFISAKNAVVNSLVDKAVTYAGFYRLPFDPVNRLTKGETERLLESMPIILPCAEPAYLLDEIKECPAQDEPVAMVRDRSGNILLPNPETGQIEAEPMEIPVMVLDAQEVSEGACLPVFNIHPDQMIDHDDAVCLGLAALVRHLRGVALETDAVYENGLGSLEIVVSDTVDHQYGQTETHIYTYFRGKRHGLTLKRTVTAGL